MSTSSFLQEKYGISEEVIEMVKNAEANLTEQFSKLDAIKEYNQYKIINAMQEERLSSTDFHWTTGYGYGDIGRDKVESIYSIIFNTEDSLVRPTIVSGTHAISLTLSALLKYGDELMEITGSPYDTLHKVIGLEEDKRGTLIDNGVKYREIDLKDGQIDTEAVIEAISDVTKVVAIQRSTGYSDRRALTVGEIKDAVSKIKAAHPHVIIFADNCYGEFTSFDEPTDVGVDIMAGSLIKNPGGGLAYTGGYVTGRRDLIDLVAKRSTAPVIEKECGLTFGQTRTNLQGLFLAPLIVNQAIKGALLIGEIYKGLGYKIVPDVLDERSDIILGIEFKSREKVVEFCKGIQEACAVDSFVVPEPWEMPGYEDEVVMAAGGFIEGSSIELSADGPMREPFYAYYQGGLTYEHCKLGAMITLRNFKEKGLL
ncbi:MAG: hypothetical protein GXZ08_07645 [Tissierellia bacterium]|nr:hypothetical protein [Tissierellia bacterium]